MKEVWKDIKGYEGLYQVSNLGRVKSLDRIVYQKNSFGNIQKNIYKGKILSLFEDKDGYLRVNLKKDKKMKQYGVHVLVANTFLNINKFKYMEYEDLSKIDINRLQINHKNENKKDNCIDNLEFCTVAYNTNYGSREQKIIQLDLSGKIIKVWDSRKKASKELHISRNTINEILRGHRQDINGYTFDMYRKEK
ncbi:NUMOD4 domain-containing protein [Intestinibacter sp.]|uniref:NUMOD4 domain-containing protein n=1 Tax=Intestinibacter sp. TaxID=1965304 RepID=UPI002A756DEE|nr:NUMOD4 domain-containing protein [Intestinibacter sp.]MDY2737048.1 NUMOD4 domain-containing protein [Intestinibacter sp.]